MINTQLFEPIKPIKPIEENCYMTIDIFDLGDVYNGDTFTLDRFKSLFEEYDADALEFRDYNGNTYMVLIKKVSTYEKDLKDYEKALEKYEKIKAIYDKYSEEIKRINEA